MLNPVVSIYNHAGTYINKTTGRAFDGVGQIDITAPDTYYALVSGTNGTGGLLAQYVLNVQIVPTSSLAKLPNLEVTNIALPTASNIQSGQPITFSWTVTNAGQAPTNVVNWSDRAVLSLDTVYGDGDDIPLAIGANNGVYGHTGVLNPGDSYTVTETVTLPDGISGNYYLLVQTDNTQQVAESAIARGDGTTVSTGGANGNGTITVNLAQYPDLVVQGLKVNGPNGDGTFSVSWNTVNNGTGAVANGWKENVVITDVTNGASIANSVLSFTGALAGNGGSAAHTLPLTGNFTVDGAGHFLVSVTTNSDQAIFESNASGHVAAVQNDSAQTTFDATRDLQGAGIAVTPPSPQSGGAVTVNWNDTNTGLLASSGSWSDTVSIVNTTTATTVASSTVGYNAAVRGNLAPGTAAPQSFTFNLPDGDLGTGVFKVTITVNATASMAEYNAAGTATTNNTATANFNAALGNYADLQVANLAVSPNAPSAGSNLTITWNDANTGHANLGQAFYDNVTVVNTTTGQTLTSTNLLYDATQAGAAIAAGGSSAQRQFQLTLPAGTAGAGVLQVSVTTDAINNVFEYAYATTPGGHQVGESNNVSTVSATSTLSNPPSLQVTNLALNPSSLQSGTPLTVTWNDKNTGTGILSQSFNDHVTIVNTTTGQTLIDADDFYDATQSGAAIAAGASSAQRQYLFTLPDGDPGTGNLSVTVTADVHNVFPAPASGHSVTATTSSTLANYADLQVTSLTATPSAAFTSGHVNFQWNDSNTGKASVTQAFNDHIVVVNTTTHQTLFTTDVPYNASGSGAAIAVGASVQRQFGFTVPDGTAAVGTLQVTVTTNFNNAVFEYNYGTIPGGHQVAQGNNAANTSFTTQIAPYPDLQVANVALHPATAATGLVSGAAVQVSWDDQNTGTADTTDSGSRPGTFHDYVLVQQVDGLGNVLANLVTAAVPSGVIAAGGTNHQNYSFHLPDGSAGTGNLKITITTNIYNEVFEQNAAGTAQTNNNGTTTGTAALAPYADLQVTSLGVTPGTGLLSGGSLVLGWNDSNTGTGATTGTFNDHVVIVNTTTGQTLATADVLYDPAASGNGAIAAGDKRARAFPFNIPAGSAGTATSSSP